MFSVLQLIDSRIKDMPFNNLCVRFIVAAAEKCLSSGSAMLIVIIAISSKLSSILPSLIFLCRREGGRKSGSAVKTIDPFEKCIALDY